VVVEVTGSADDERAACDDEHAFIASTAARSVIARRIKRPVNSEA
jgi:hypothetical protein